MLTDDELLVGFIEDARGNMSEIEPALLTLENDPQNLELINQLFRSVHSLKGGAGFFGLNKMSSLAHIMENLLSLARSSKLLLEKPHIDALLSGFDRLNQMIDDPSHSEQMDIVEIHHRLETLAQGGPVSVPPKPASTPEASAAPPPAVAGPAPASASVALPATSSAPLAAPASAAQSTPAEPAHTEEAHPEPEKSGHPAEAHPPAQATSRALSAPKAEESIRVNVSRLNQLMDLAGELVLVRNQILRLSESLVKQLPGLGEVLLNFNTVTTELQEKIMNTRMQPVSVVFGKFPRVVRELANQLNKEIELVTEGNDVELDKTIIESLSDPLTHIVRNTADHGIELPAERVRKGKSSKGTLLLKAYHESGQVIIEVTDDGKGIDPEIVTRKALEKGVITPETAQKMSDQEKVNLVFAPGFSTAEKVSAVSGRGVGMDVVRSNIEQIGGTVDIRSVKGEGTTLVMTLPLTMAIVSCLIVETQGYRFAFPQVNLEELVVVKAEQYANMMGKVQGQDVLRLRGALVPLISLAKGLGISQPHPFKTKKAEVRRAKPSLQVLIVKVSGNRVAISVDSILDIEEIVVKPMPEYLKQVESFSGATILGDGTIAMIVDIVGFIEKNQLLMSDQLSKDQIKERHAEKNHEEQSLLLFDNGTEEQFAITMSLIQRVDHLDAKQVQHIGHKEYMAYRNEQMRILRLEDFLNIQKPEHRSQMQSVIVPKHARIPVGILIHQVIDTKNVEIRMERSSLKEKGILGSALIDGKITLMLDLYTILELGEPNSVKGVIVEQHKTKNKRLLLVEDTPFFLAVVESYLSSVGFQITTATNGREALEALKAHDFDLVLTDIEMPLMDGRELVKNIRANPAWGDLPVIALTSINDPQVIAAEKKVGFNEWLLKLDKENLLDNLVKYL